MRKIDKSEILSVKYKEWLFKNREANKKHKTCSYYERDVFMSLLYCQKGVCAYTEMRLCAPELIERSQWDSVRYSNENVKIETFGHLEHFNPKLKKEYFCEWDNLFVIHGKVNVVKNDRDIELIKEFKPDSENYNPENIFDYDVITNKFRPKSDIENSEERAKIQKLIDMLLINQRTVKYERETFLNDVKYNPNKSIDRFYTAYEMVKDILISVNK